jgi:signal transduction histidine kinase/HD-like signal output (HDOD) protein
MAEAKDKRVELILQQLHQLPTLPSVAVRVLEVTGRDDSSAQQVVSLISSDPSLTAKILQLVHRADAGVRGEVNSVERAVVLLGFEAVRSAVLAVSVFQTLDPHEQRKEGRFNREHFWKHAIAVACCAELLAQAADAKPMRQPKNLQWREAEPLDANEAFVCGLLHDLGKVALDLMLPKSYDRVVEAADLLRGNIADLERSVVGIDHMVIGKRLAERWSLPVNLRDCMWLHGQSPEALPNTVKNARLVNLITLADSLVREQHIGYSGNYTFPVNRAALMQAVGVAEEKLQQIQQQLLKKIEERATALGLGSASSGELYISALTQANQELARMSEQLASKNRRLSIRAKLFDALAQFQGDLRPDAPPAMVLEAIGQTAVHVLGASPVSIFSAQPGQAYAEVVMLDEHGECIGTSVVDCPPVISRPIGGDGPVLSMGLEMEWLLANVSPRLGGDQRYWMCLEAEGACIGGVIWGSRTGEAQRLSIQANELTALCNGWALALRTSQIREESRVLNEQLAEVNRQLQNAQNELLRSRTLATVGEMAAGAAHEMNNPLAVISGRSQLLASQLSDAKLKHAANTIAEQSHRLSQIITELMEFAKPVPAHPVQSDLAEMIDRAVYEAKSLAEAGQRKIEITMGEVPPVVVDPQQVQSAFVEILHNAFQATDDSKGEIAIHAAYDSFSSRVVVTVRDNGCGMDEQTLKRAFDPFFSSLPAGRRRGMGLPKALRWVECSGGNIRLESHQGQGTRAMILLPAAWPVPGANAEGSSSSHQIRKAAAEG